MKKGIASFLLLLMTLTAVQPALAFHFCGGQLRSVTFGKNARSCCDKVPDNDNIFTDNWKDVLSKPLNVCCLTYTADMATDRFQLPGQSSGIEMQRATPFPVWFLCDTVLDGNESGVSLSLQHIFPPGGLFRYSTDLLTWICIFRI